MKLQNSIFVKLGVVCGLVIMLLIPLSMIRGVVLERSGYRALVVQDIAATWTGEQLLVGPIINLPYQVRYQERRWNKHTEAYEHVEKLRWESASLMPETLNIVGSIPVEKRFRGIYGVPVYAASLQISGSFAAADVAAIRAATKGFEKFGNGEFALAVGDVRGIDAVPSLDWNGQPVSFVPGSGMRGIGEGIHAPLTVDELKAPMQFSMHLQLRGSTALRFAPLAGSVSVKLDSPWAHPRFDGRFLPVTRRVGADGFAAQWRTSSFSSGAPQLLENCVNGQCDQLASGAFGVQFIETVDLYQKVTRALKYGVLFIGLTFVAFFLTESLTARILHPLQYLLVGISLAMFYLLLVSLSEHIGFANAYALSTFACVTLIWRYLSGVLASARIGLAFAAGIASLYSMLFVILRSEDFALLMGSALLFAMLAGIMLLTRRVNWYELKR